MCFCLSVSAQQSERQYDMYDNDNLKYHYDIGFESGLYGSLDFNGFQPGTIHTLHGSYFFRENFGFRSGISLISEIGGSDYYKIPVLFSARTKTFNRYWNITSDNGLLHDFFLNVFLSLLPTRFEVNIGPSLGYIPHYNSRAHYYDFGRKVYYDSFNDFSIASSLDTNLRLSFQFWRICVNGNVGFNYLWTKNYNVYQLSENIKPSWFTNTSIGVSFRF